MRKDFDYNIIVVLDFTQRNLELIHPILIMGETTYANRTLTIHTEQNHNRWLLPEIPLIDYARRDNYAQDFKLIDNKDETGFHDTQMNILFENNNTSDNRLKKIFNTIKNLYF